MTFQSESWLWALLLLPPLAAALWAWGRQRRRAGARWADPAVMAVGPGRGVRAGRAAAALVALLAVGAGVVALARPSVDATENEHRSAVVLTIDVSNSMLKKDLAPDRLEAALDAARRFVREAPSSTSVGIVTFADEVRVVLAPTQDRDAALAALDGIDSTREGTALGEGVLTALSALRSAGAVPDAPGDPSDSPGRILVLTDGANSIRKATSPAAAADRAAQDGVPVYSILLGNDAGRPDQPLPAETLAGMATRTGGLFAQSTTNDDLTAVFSDIGSIVAPVDKLRELSVWFAAGALGLLALAAGLLALARPRVRRATGVRTA
ncbi:MAG: VWA domain-containing protein [Thermoleophilia bacterium]